MGKQIPVVVIPDTDTAPPRVYANGAVISHSSIDFTLNFFDFIPPLEHEIEDGENADLENIKRVVPIVTRVALSPEVIPGLIKALEENYEKYTKERG